MLRISCKYIFDGGGKDRTQKSLNNKKSSVYKTKIEYKNVAPDISPSYPIGGNRRGAGGRHVMLRGQGIFLENDFWTLPPGPPSYQFCTWILYVRRI